MIEILSEIFVAIFFVYGLYCALQEGARLAGRFIRRLSARGCRKGSPGAPPH